MNVIHKLVVFAATGLCAILFADNVDGQQVRRLVPAQGIQFRVGRGPLIVRQDGLSDEDFEDELAVTSGASLKTDPELEAILEQAERLRSDGNFRIAAKLWQAVLERSGDTLYSSDGKIYFSLVEQVEKIIAGLPTEGLEVYRIVADASAKEIMASGDGLNDMNALNKVVRQYFLSSDGDDAAFRLGQIYMDKYDFIGARRIFNKIVHMYPDPSVSIEQVYLRIAVCESFLGDEESARQSLQQGEDIAFNAVRDRRYSLVRKSIGNLTPGRINSKSTGWTMPMGDRRRFGVMPSVPASMMKSDLVAKWQYYFEPRDHYSRFKDAEGRVLVGEDILNGKAQGTAASAEIKAQKNWREKEWRPAGHLLVQSGRLYFKSAADLVAWDLSDVDAAVESQDAEESSPNWRSLWQNSFRLDDASLLLRNIRGNFSAYGRRRGVEMGDDNPAADNEVQVFGDAIYQQMTIHDGTLYSIECESFDGENQNAERSNQNPAWNASIRRTRENFISAYDAESGKALWQLPRKEELNQPKVDERWLHTGGFMAAPIKFGDYLIVPVNQGGAISIYALDPREQGKTVWKSFLCDEPESSANPQSPINLSIEGSDLFVSCGVGVVFVVDPTTGLVRFAKRYLRNGRPDLSFQRMSWANPRTVFEGWSEDVVIPYGRQMICFCSDCDVIYAYDRNSGETIWYMNRETHYGLDVDYLLGVYDDVLYAAGRETVIAIDLQSEGSLLWGGNNLFGKNVSYGRGMLTKDGLFIPVGNSIYHFGLKSIKYEPPLIGKVAVDLGTDAPVGNLFSDGKRIWVHGGSRLYGLWNRDPDKQEQRTSSDSE